MNKIIIIIVLLSFSGTFFGCATMQPNGSRSNVGYCALAGAGIGSGLGAATRLKRPAKNALIGGILGALTGALICDIIERKAEQATVEAARTQRQVQYQTENGQRITATPVRYNPTDNCQDIVNEAWDSDGTYLGKVPRRVCTDNNGNFQLIRS